MGTKRITGIVLLILGIVLIIFSIHSMQRISGAKGAINTMTSPFSGSSGGQMAGGMMEHEASKYDVTVKVLLYAGIGLTAIGGCMAIFCKKKKRG